MPSFKHRQETKYIVVHCSGTKPSQDIGAKEIRRWHKEKGSLDLGYHFVIRRDGSVEQGREIGVHGTHCDKLNPISIGICLVGGVTEDAPVDRKEALTDCPENNFTPAQFAALYKMLVFLDAKFPGALPVGHRDVYAQYNCPSFDVKSWYAATASSHFAGA